MTLPPTVSVVMSVFNSAGSLNRTLDSIMGQAGVEFEFIVVNDGSTDDSGEILDRRSELDSRLVVLHQENTGLTIALRRGCEIAKGRYIARQDAGGDVSFANRLSKQERFTFVLSGGSTPKQLYSLLAESPYKESIDWTKIHFFWGDERAVPFEDSRNNAKMCYDELLDKVPVNPAHIHVMRTDIAPEEAAVEYERILKEYFKDSKVTFDFSSSFTASVYDSLTNSSFIMLSRLAIIVLSILVLKNSMSSLQFSRRFLKIYFKNSSATSIFPLISQKVISGSIIQNSARCLVVLECSALNVGPKV